MNSMVTTDDNPTAVDVKIDKLTSDADVYALVDSLREASSSSSAPIALDFRSLARARPQRINAHRTEIVANALLTEFAETDLIVHPPSSPNGRKNLERAGLAFAIRQRPPRLTHLETDRQKESWPAVDWGRTWSPFDSNFRQRIFEVGDEPDVLLDGKFVTFLNPHAYAADDDLVWELTENQAGEWISQLVRTRPTWVDSVHELGERKKTQQELIGKLRRVIYELVTNLSYAFCSHNVAGRARRNFLQRSYVQLYVTRGGTNSFDRLHFVAADTGFGIVATLLPKLVRSGEYDESSSELIIRQLINTELPDYGRSSGRGYDRITSILKEYSGDLFLTTGFANSSGQCQTMRAHSQYVAAESSKLRIIRDERLRFRGTTAHVILRLDESNRDDLDKTTV
ncbi:hypothetical protein [Candidatus Poriferisodalis sp.]|uniref:hypothetical protein n=1 Tax=Candidatus Poriferisodalis sp. TaxID=3101277 RepID=UPI003AF6409C